MAVAESVGLQTGAAAVEDAAQKSAGCCSCGGSLTEVTELVEEAELEAMHELLKLMYFQKAPSAASTELLLQCLRLADRYQAMHCTDLLLAALAAKGKDIITYSIAVQLFSMPQGQQEQPSFKHLIGTCKQRIVDQFCNVPTIIQSDDLLQQFCALPFAAVLAWAESDQLQVHSENCVVYLVSAWVAAQEKMPGGHKVSARQGERLAHQVRVLHLGPAYQFFVLPNLEWFKGCSGMSHMPTLLAYKGVNDKGVPVFPAPGRRAAPGWGVSDPKDNEVWAYRGRAAWVAGPRQRISPSQSSPEFTLSWELGPDQLQQLDAGKPLWSASNLYASGFQFQCSVRMASKTLGGPARGMYYHIASKQMSQHGVPWVDAASVMIGKVVFKGSIIGSISSSGTKTAVLERSLSALEGQGRGAADALPPFNSKMRVEMTVSGVDLPI